VYHSSSEYNTNFGSTSPLNSRSSLQYQILASQSRRERLRTIAVLQGHNFSNFAATWFVVWQFTDYDVISNLVSMSSSLSSFNTRLFRNLFLSSAGITEHNLLRYCKSPLYTPRHSQDNPTKLFLCEERYAKVLYTNNFSSTLHFIFEHYISQHCKLYLCVSHENQPF
jgi:hypothetical protein